MAAASIAAFSALAVAVVGNIVNFIIARQARIGALETSRLAAALRVSEQKVVALREQSRAAEHLRIAAWRLEQAVIDACQRRAPSPTDLESADQQYREAFQAFDNSWAEVRASTVNGELLEFAREIRHTSRNAAIGSLNAFLVFQQSDTSHRHRQARELAAELRYLRDHLDMLIEVVNGVQMAEIRTAFFGNDTLSPRESWHSRVVKSVTGSRDSVSSNQLPPQT